MTTYSKRRGRRSLAAILAAMLIASVLAVVAGSPAQAANTASEVRVDHDNNPKTATVRQFAGDTRYETALALAKSFADNNGGIGGLPVAFVASGESLVDAVTVSALAGDLNAPVLLTRGGELHRGVGDFLENYGVGTVHVLGGTAAISDAVVTAIEALVHEPTVTRIAGDNRYATAAAIASALNGSRSWCDADEEAAVLVNGGDTSLAAATVIGPVANRLAVPVLLTASDELPEVTRTWIDDNGIEHVVIVGSTADVSADVAKMLTADGVDVVERIGGDTAGELSVNVAKAITGDCADDLAPVALNQAALVNGWGRDVAPDAITAAPVLSDGDLVPILLVGDTLPASVREYLAATPSQRGADKVHYRLLAIGGTAAVSEAVMTAAIAAAASADALTVAITNNVDTPTADGYGNPPAIGDTSFTLRFNDRVAHGDSDNLQGKLRDIVLINGVPATFTVAAADTDGTLEATESGYRCDSAIVRITGVTALKAGDVISVAGSTLEIGDGGDQRTVASTSVTVPAKAVDNTGPKITIVGVEDQNGTDPGVVQVTVTSDDLGTENGDAALTIDNAETANIANDGEVRATRGGKSLVLSAISDVTLNAQGSATFELTLGTQDAGVDAEWKANDQITFMRGALVDAEGNDSPRAHGRVEAAKAFPKATAIRVSAQSHTNQAGMSLADALTGGTADQVMLSAKKDGNAGGVYGNGWMFRLRKASGHATAGDAVNIVVSVDPKGRRVVATINSGVPTYGDLKSALEAHSAFAALFDVKIASTTATETACASPLSDTKLVIADGTTGLDTAAPFAGGRTTMAAEVTFNGYVQTIDTTQASALLADVLAGAAGRGIDVANVAQTAGDATTSAAVVFTAPSKMARIEIVAVTTSAGILLQPGQGKDRVVIDANTVATGYADDGDTETDDTGNAASTLWMHRSSSVKAPS
ncbi:cell wall-binding repeat-containing protein [Candidatus Poriferisodalis sp.]|uniref:cell wall-binding repeat-containing protein n=1 Tax=Candidatus Poriferisodalis sp. TaxID=3101277 RepID=UPI003B01393C